MGLGNSCRCKGGSAAAPSMCILREELCSCLNVRVLSGRCSFFSFFNQVDGRPSLPSLLFPVVGLPPFDI